MHDTLWNRRGIIKTANVSAIREMRASVCIETERRSVVISPFSKDEENDDDEGECVCEREALLHLLLACFQFVDIIKCSLPSFHRSLPLSQERINTRRRE